MTILLIALLLIFPLKGFAQGVHSFGPALQGSVDYGPGVSGDTYTFGPLTPRQRVYGPGFGGSSGPPTCTQTALNFSIGCNLAYLPGIQ